MTRLSSNSNIDRDAVPPLKISVALATFNGEAYLGQQLDSIAGQTRRPDEIVIGDDQSTDGTMTILEEFAQRAGLNVSIQRNSLRLGSSRNFEVLIRRCTGDIILLSDQDDIWRNDKVERTEQAFLTNPKALYVFSDGLLIGADGKRTRGSLWKGALFSRSEQRLYAAGRGIDVLMRHNVVTGAALAVRRQSALEALPIPGGWVHDYWLAHFLEASAPECQVMLNQQLLFYRQHRDQQIGLFRFSIRHFRTLLGRVLDPKFYHNESKSISSLAARLRDCDAPTDTCRALDEKAIFFSDRYKLRVFPALAPAIIYRHWKSGSYNRYTPAFFFFRPAIYLDVMSSFWFGVSGGAGGCRKD